MTRTLCSSDQVIWLLEVKAHVALHAQDGLLIWGTFKSYLGWMLNTSPCYQQKWKFPSPYDSFSCCDSCLKSMIFINSPAHPGGLRTTRKKNGTAEATTMSAGSPSSRLLQWIGLYRHKASSFSTNALIFHMTQSSWREIKYRFFPS